MIEVTKQVQKALDHLEAAGYEAFLVGGCVRDALMGNTASDFDLATNARPEAVAQIFAGYRVIETGRKHGTVTVLLEETPLEITTYRVEGAYSDARHPDEVRFAGSIEEDLGRRDFTVNAMAYHPRRGLVDLFGGQLDLAARVIRCVGEPKIRFGEDALRILRGLRFASMLEFAIEEETGRAILAQKDLLGRISAERIQGELTKLLCGPGVRRILLDYTDVLGVVIPELLPMKGFDQKTKYHCYDVLEHTAVALEHTPADKVLRWAVLLHDIGKPRTFSVDDQGAGHFYGHNKVSGEMAGEILERLRFDKASRERIVTLVSIHDTIVEPEPRIIRRWLNRLSPDLFFDLLQVKRADNRAQSPAFQERLAICAVLEKTAKQVLEEEGVFGLGDLAVKGTDLLDLGYQGRAIGQGLALLLDAVLDGSIPNEKEELLRYLERLPR